MYSTIVKKIIDKLSINHSLSDEEKNFINKSVREAYEEGQPPSI